MDGMLFYERIGIVIMLLSLAVGILGAFIKGRLSERLMITGFILACFAALWMIWLYIFGLFGL